MRQDLSCKLFSNFFYESIKNILILLFYDLLVEHYEGYNDIHYGTLTLTHDIDMKKMKCHITNDILT